ncbi:LPS export ABC transporter periplasmic protein LptC [Belnapia sp. F-4-1]|uniref:LPS export ABC transporter periplasmic protein LptC n=1 Tax=Belnapia sp. F-4-1 TaxID=1545443 RepID=UPI001F37E5DF|nr:LPS export ABC transporter periplasmic protein LptC [Belnapia sp. F-4-1]
MTPDRPPLAQPATGRVSLPADRAMLPLSRARRGFSQGQMARRRFFVRWTKRLLPALALALLGLVMFWPEIEGNEDRSRVSFRRMVMPRAEGLRVVNPRYQGIDELNRPFTVTARTGQQPGAERVLDLEEPRADMLLSDGAWVYLQAHAGRFDRAANHLDLKGDVTIYHDSGVTMLTETAAVETEAGTASGDAPVAAQGSFGTITSNGFRILERGAVVVFTGNAHAVLEGGRQ